MPYVKTHVDDLSKLLGAYDLKNGRRLALVLCMSPTSACRRIHNPEELTVRELTVRELRLLASRGHVPIEDIRGAI